MQIAVFVVVKEIWIGEVGFEPGESFQALEDSMYIRALLDNKLVERMDKAKSTPLDLICYGVTAISC
jgi:hypothetical protein